MKKNEAITADPAIWAGGIAREMKAHAEVAAEYRQKYTTKAERLCISETVERWKPALSPLKRNRRCSRYTRELMTASWPCCKKFEEERC